MSHIWGQTFEESLAAWSGALMDPVDMVGLADGEVKYQQGGDLHSLLSFVLQKARAEGERCLAPNTITAR